MRTFKRYFIVTALLLSAYLLSACNGVLSQSEQRSDRQAAIKVNAMEVAFTGVIEAMNGNQWTVDGQDITVDPSVIHDGPFAVGDTVKIEGALDENGVVQVTKAENPELADLVPSPDPIETQSPDAIGTQEPVSTESPDPVSTSSPDDPNKTGVSDIDNGNEIFGTVEAINGDIWTIDGQDYTLADFTEIKGLISVGDNVKIHVVANADGTLTIREVEQSTGLSNDSGNSNDNASHDMSDDQNSYDDNSNDAGDDSYSSSSSSADDSSSHHDSDDDHDSSNSSSDSTNSNSSSYMDGED